MKARVSEQGVLCKISQYSESSLILHVFGRQRGMVSVLAKGIRKKQEQDLLAVLSEYEFNLYESVAGGLYLLGDFSLSVEHDFSQSVQKWAAAQCAVELYSKLIIPTEEAPVYYKLLQTWLEYLPGVEGSVMLVWWRFLLRVFILLGIPFSATPCALCQQSPEHYAAYEKGSARLVCSACCESLPDQDRLTALSPLSARILQLLPGIGNYLGRLNPDSIATQQLNQLFEDYYQAHFNRDLKLRSLQVLAQLSAC